MYLVGSLYIAVRENRDELFTPPPPVLFLPFCLQILVGQRVECSRRYAAEMERAMVKRAADLVEGVKSMC